MRTTLDIDDAAMAEAMAVAGKKTKTAVINEALRDYARRKRVRGLLELQGKGDWSGDIDKLRKRR